MNRRTFGYALFVVIVIVILTSMPFLVGKIDPIYLLLIIIALGLLWPILRIYTRKTSQLNREENVDT
jgi:positive regulator of sigma E activity